MRKKVESILGFPVPKKLEFILQRLIIQGCSAEKIAKTIKNNMT